ncbi:MAG: hypothetical protein ACKPCM_15520 [Pseudanabaena sp.]
MQTLSPTFSPTISPKISQTNIRVTDTETDFLPTIAQSSVLQTALAGLDASLNDELDRYRHWQENGQTISYLNPFRPRAVSTKSIWTSPSLSEALSPLTPPVEFNSDHRPIQMPVMPPMGANASIADAITNAELHQYRGLDLDSVDNPSHSGINADLDRAVAYAQSLHGYGNAVKEINSANAIPNVAPNIEPKMAQIPKPDDDEILQGFADDYANNYADNYRDSVNQEYAYPAPPDERSALRSLMNPVGIISLLLLLCSSAAIGYLMVDPSGVMKLFKPEQKTKAAQASNADSGKDINLQNSQKSNDLSFVPFSAGKTQVNVDSLAKNSKTIADPTFVNKNNTLTKNSSVFAPNSAFVNSSPLRTVPSALPPMSVAPLPPALAPLERSYTPAPVPGNEPVPTRSYREPTPSRTSSSPASKPLRNVSVAPATTPAPVPEYVVPRNNMAVKYAAPLSSNPTSSPAQSSYRVVVENSYAASAQQIERDAYVRPSDGQVQVGSYRDPKAAQQRIEQLRRQGIPARIE